jgi:hypothetical protein
MIGIRIVKPQHLIETLIYDCQSRIRIVKPQHLIETLIYDCQSRSSSNAGEQLGVVATHPLFPTLIIKLSGTDLRRLKLGFYREWGRWLMLEAAQLDGDLAS